jgi:hypothetical protein
MLYAAGTGFDSEHVTVLAVHIYCGTGVAQLPDEASSQTIGNRVLIPGRSGNFSFHSV